MRRVIARWPALPPEVRNLIERLVGDPVPSIVPASHIQSPAVRSAGIVAELILTAATAMNPAFPTSSGPLVFFALLRRHPKLQGIDKPTFDSAVLHMAQTAGVACIHQHDHAWRLSAEERDDLVTDGRSDWIGISTK